MEKAYLDMPKNFMTPEIRKWDIVGAGEDMRVVELSRGRDFDGEDMYGVSEFKECKNAKYGLETTGRSELFKDKEKAHKYYLALTF